MKILITAPYNLECRNELESMFGKVVYLPWNENGQPYNGDELLKLILKHDVDGLITEIDEVNEKVINSSQSLKFIGVCRANPVNVDVEAASKKGISVFNTPARNAQAVTELLISSLISFLRNIVPSNKFIEERRWNESDNRPYLKFRGNELAGKTVGFVGFGAVGKRVANILRHFPCHIQFYDPFVEDFDLEYKKINLQELFETSDIVSVHLPVNNSTKGMIDAKLLNGMKRNAVFVNTARSIVVDNDALYDTLVNQRIRGAVLDVFDHEPPLKKEVQLMTLPNVLATPHIAGASYEVEDHHAFIMNENLKESLINKQLKNVFNVEELTKIKQY